MKRDREYVPKGAAVERHRKIGRAEQYAEQNEKRRASGDAVFSPSANRKKKRHGRP